MEKLELPNNYFICGRTKSGKTNLMKYLIREAGKKKQIDYMFVISPSSRITGKDYNFLDRKYVHADFNKQSFRKILKIQRANSFPNCVLILDDCVGSKFFKQDDGLKVVFATARHYNITVFLITQNPTDVSNCVKEQIYTSYIFKQQSSQSIRNAYQILANKFESLEEYKKINDNLKPYQFVYSKLEEDAKLMKVPVCKKFTVKQ